MENIKEEKSKYTPHKCPVCSGFGTLSYGKLKCHGCDGKGYVVLSDEGEPQ